MHDLLFNNRTDNHKGLVFLLAFMLICSGAFAQQTSPNVMAKETEKKMTDQERFGMIISVMGSDPSIGLPHDKRIPEGVSMSAGYTSGVPRLGVPAIQSSDASMGVTNPGYRPDGKGATAMPHPY